MHVTTLYVPFLFSLLQHWNTVVSLERWPAYVVRFPFNLAVSYSHQPNQYQDFCLHVDKIMCAGSYNGVCAGINPCACVCNWVGVHIGLLVISIQEEKHFSQPLSNAQSHPNETSSFLSLDAPLSLFSFEHTYRYTYTNTQNFCCTKIRSITKFIGTA